MKKRLDILVTERGLAESREKAKALIMAGQIYVVNLERTNARYLTREQIPEEVQFFSVDVSFISLTLILPAVRELLAPGGQAVCLIKPQFEAGREKVGKKGVVRDRAVHEEVIEKIRCFALENGYSVLGLTYSPVKGPEGNIEYLILSLIHI